ncbi:MAG: PH domain-containing protein [Planctomycetota bacterium]|nr:PH domain-containing protein [Planctomycetota bacterium]
MKKQPEAPPRFVAAAAASEAGAAAAALPPRSARATSLATLLASHVLRDGELVLMILRPSFWFIVFTSASFTAIAIVASLIMAELDHGMHDRIYFEAAMFVISGRVMWAVLQWMGRLYILTDQRVLRLSGIFSIDVFDCPLRKIVRARIVSPLRERVVGAGSIEIIPRDESMPTAVWQTVDRPAEVYERLMAAINRARQSGGGFE